MSAEEKQNLLPKEETKKEKPVVDYSKKDYYDYLGLKKDASEETIKSTYAELSKKYHPITNPDEIKRYQQVEIAGQTLTDPVTKKFYDEYGEVSLLLYNLFNIIFPFKQVEKPSTYIHTCLFSVSGICACLFIIVMAGIARFIEAYVFNWLYAFIPTLVICGVYFIYGLFRWRRDVAAAKCVVDEKEACKSKDEANKKNYINFIQVLLLVIFQLALADYCNSKYTKSLFVVSIPYIIFELINLYRDYLMFSKGAEVIKTGKECDCSLIKNDVYIKFLAGKANVKGKDGKKEAAASYFGYLAFYIFKSDVLRFVQCILMAVAFVTGPSNYTLFFLPTFLFIVGNIVQSILESKLGYVKGTTESAANIIMNFIYFLIDFDTVFYLLSVNHHIIALTSQAFPFLVECALCIGFSLGVLPFVLIMEFKFKHDELDVPL